MAILRTTPPAHLPARFWLIALLLHLAILAYPLGRALQQSLPGSPPLEVVVASPRPVAAPAAPSAPPRPANTPPPRAATPVLQAAQPSHAPVAPAPAVPANTPPASPQAAAATAAAAPPGPPAAAPAPVSVQAARFDAAYLNNPRPPYPPLSRRLNEEGKVTLRVLVSSDGQALQVEVAQSSRFPRLDEAARQTVERWRFIPARRGSEATESHVLVPLIFRLED